MTFFELDPCTNCKKNQWRLGVRDTKTGRTEFMCLGCATNVYIRTTAEGYKHLAGGE